MKKGLVVAENPAPKKSSLISLPPEVMTKIMGYLVPTDLRSLIVTCRNMAVTIGEPFDQERFYGAALKNFSADSSISASEPWFLKMLRRPSLRAGVPYSTAAPLTVAVDDSMTARNISGIEILPSDDVHAVAFREDSPPYLRVRGAMQSVSVTPYDGNGLVPRKFRLDHHVVVNNPDTGNFRRVYNRLHSRNRLSISRHDMNPGIAMLCERWGNSADIWIAKAENPKLIVKLDDREVAEKSSLVHHLSETFGALTWKFNDQEDSEWASYVKPKTGEMSYAHIPRSEQNRLRGLAEERMRYLYDMGRAGFLDQRIDLSTTKKDRAISNELERRLDRRQKDVDLFTYLKGKSRIIFREEGELRKILFAQANEANDGSITVQPGNKKLCKNNAPAAETLAAYHKKYGAITFKLDLDNPNRVLILDPSNKKKLGDLDLSGDEPLGREVGRFLHTYRLCPFLQRPPPREGVTDEGLRLINNTIDLSATEEDRRRSLEMVERLGVQRHTNKTVAHLRRMNQFTKPGAIRAIIDHVASGEWSTGEITSETRRSSAPLEKTLHAMFRAVNADGIEVILHAYGCTATRRRDDGRAAHEEHGGRERQAWLAPKIALALAQNPHRTPAQSDAVRQHAESPTITPKELKAINNALYHRRFGFLRKNFSKILRREPSVTTLTDISPQPATQTAAPGSSREEGGAFMSGGRLSPVDSRRLAPSTPPLSPGIVEKGKAPTNASAVLSKADGRPSSQSESERAKQREERSGRNA